MVLKNKKHTFWGETNIEGIWIQLHHVVTGTNIEGHITIVVVGANTSI
jgi:predicted small secreted protein